MGKSFKLRNGLLLLSTEAPGGVYNATQLKKIAALCEADSAIAKATEDQRLAIFAPSDKAALVAKELRSVGLGVRHYQDGLHQPVNCIGELCGEHQQDAMGASMDLARSLGGIVLTAAPLKIGINGCGRCCVPTHTLDISVIGESHGYRISLGGRSVQLPELATYLAEGVPPAELPGLLTKVVNLYKTMAQPGETLQDVIERCGSKPFIEALAPYSQDGFDSDSLEIGGDSVSSSELESALELPVDAPLEGIPEPEYEEIDVEEPLALADEPVMPAKAPERAPAVSAASPSKATAPAKLATNLSDLLVDPMDGLPGFDPSLEGSHAASGPTIDGMDLMGDDHGVMALDRDLLGDELLPDEPIAILDEPAMLDDQGPEMTDSMGLAEPGDDLSLTEEPLAPVEADFDAQEALSDDFEELPLPSADQLPAPESEDIDLEAIAGIDPIETPIAVETVPNQVKKSDVAANATPLEDVASEGEFEAEKGAEVIDGADADELEAKLAASIAAEESITPVEDENAAARLEAMNLITGAESVTSPESVDDVLGAPDDFSDLQIDAEPLMSPEIINGPDIGEGDFEYDEGDDLVPEEKSLGDSEIDQIESLSDEEAVEASPAQEVPLSTGKGSKAPLKNPSASTRESSGLPAPKAASTDPERNTPKVAEQGSSKSADPGASCRGGAPSPTANGFALSGVDLIGDGRVSLAFASGVSLVVDPRMISPGMTKGFNFGGQRINITSIDQGLNVEVDGVTIFLPVAAA